MALNLAVRDGNKRRMIHVPKQWEDSVTEWVANYQEMKTLMEKVSLSCLSEFKAGKEEEIPGPQERKRRR